MMSGPLFRPALVPLAAAHSWPQDQTGQHIRDHACLAGPSVLHNQQGALTKDQRGYGFVQCGQYLKWAVVRCDTSQGGRDQPCCMPAVSPPTRLLRGIAALALAQLPRL